jgi:predicted ATPase
MARLDRLATVKDVAQLGATIGRTFAYELFRAVSPLDDATLQQGLRQLMEAELIYQQGVPPQATYTFKHALIQDTAYQSLLRSTRQQYHQRIARVLEAQFAETVETQPELLAHHYTEAGLSAPAVAYWQRAGQRASQRSANLEAIGHLTKGLEVLRTLPDTPDRAQQELLVQTTLGPALIATQGYAAPDVEQTYARARALCEQIGETPQLFPVLWGLRQFYHVRGALHTAYALGEQLLTLARSTQDASRLLEAHLALGHTLFFMGEFAQALAHLEQSMALYDPQQHHTHVLVYGQDPRVFCLSYMAVSLWHLGYADRAIQKQHEALTLAQDLAHPFSQAVALFFAAIFYQFCREVVATRKYAELAIALCRERGFSQYGAMGAILRGWALTEQDQSEEGIAQMRQGLTAMRATGAELARPHFLVLLAEAYHTAKQPEAGLAVLAELLAAGPHREARHYEAALYRLKGDLLVQSRVRGLKSELSHPVLRTPHLLETAACFRQALEIAHRQQAKAWELRTAMSLSRLWQRQGRCEEGRELLAAVYGWFTEGFDTKDLQEAKELLEELS